MGLLGHVAVLVPDFKEIIHHCLLIGAFSSLVVWGLFSKFFFVPLPSFVFFLCDLTTVFRAMIPLFLCVCTLFYI